MTSASDTQASERPVDDGLAKIGQRAVTVHQAIKIVHTVRQRRHEAEGEVCLDGVGALHVVDDCRVEIPYLTFAALLAIVLVGGIIILRLHVSNDHNVASLCDTYLASELCDPDGLLELIVPLLNVFNHCRGVGAVVVNREAVELKVMQLATYEDTSYWMNVRCNPSSPEQSPESS